MAGMRSIGSRYSGICSSARAASAASCLRELAHRARILLTPGMAVSAFRSRSGEAMDDAHPRRCAAPPFHRGRVPDWHGEESAGSLDRHSAASSSPVRPPHRREEQSDRRHRHLPQLSPRRRVILHAAKVFAFFDPVTAKLIAFRTRAGPPRNRFNVRRVRSARPAVGGTCPSTTGIRRAAACIDWTRAPLCADARRSRVLEWPGGVRTATM